MSAIVIIFCIVLPILLIIAAAAVLLYFFYFNKKKTVDKAGYEYRFNYTVNHGDFIQKLKEMDNTEQKKEDA